MKKQNSLPAAKQNKEATTTQKKYAWSRGGRRRHEKPQDFKGSFRKLLAYLSPFTASLLVVLVFSLCASLLEVWGPDRLGGIIDIVNKQIKLLLTTQIWEPQPVYQALSKLALIYGGVMLFSFGQTYLLAGITQGIVRALRENVNGKLSRLPLKYYDDNAKGEILSRVMNDIENMSKVVQNNFVRLLSSVVTFVGVTFMMFVTNWRLTLFTFLFLPPCLVVVWFISRRSKRYFRQQWDRTGELNGHIEEMFTGHTLVKVFGHEQKAIAEFDDINGELTKVSRLAQFISGTVGPILNFVGNIGIVLLCVVGGSFVVGEAMSVGDIVKFFTYSSMFIQPIMSFGNIFNNLQSALASSERVFTLMDEAEEPPDNAVYTIDKPTGRVAFEDVSFQYVPDKPLIQGLQLDVQPNKLIAIVGPTGAGKTTIVNLLMRFYDVQKGAITVDGIDIRKISRKNLRTVFGMVLQDTWLFKGTLADNIAYGRLGASEEEIQAAACAARVENFLYTLPDGLNSEIEEDGSNLSQGQRQLVTIARAILANPSILILDEATSSVDTRTEILIQQAMQTLMEGRTSFVIAHRLSTIREADCILVMNDGGIVETGTHKELLAQNGFYKEIYNSQFGVIA